jgi:hypothetical protein
MLCPALEHADTIEILGPCKLYLIATFPDAILIIAPGTKNGEIFLGPLSLRIKALSSIVPKPPMPEPIETPILVFSIFSRDKSASFIA